MHMMHRMPTFDTLSLYYILLDVFCMVTAITEMKTQKFTLQPKVKASIRGREWG